MSDYDIDSDVDLNKYESDDIKDLTLAGIGEAGRELDVNMSLIIILVVVSIVLSLILGFKLAGKKLLGR